MQRNIAHVPRRSTPAVRRRRACPARVLSSSALSPVQNNVPDLPVLAHTALGHAAGVAKPSNFQSEDADRVQRVSEFTHWHALRRASAPALRDLCSLAAFSASSEPTTKSSSNSEPEPQHDPEPEQNGDGEISDQEWEIRTGRAIYILQQTLPGFFHTGLITAFETPIVPRAPDARGDPHCEGRTELPDVESIYSRHIRLKYTPPHPLPAPFPRTFTIEGSALYLASSAFLRHTLNALYTDLQVKTTRVRVLGSGSSSGHRGADGSQPDPEGGTTRKHRSPREKSLFISLSVSGTARVSGARGGWDVNSTYRFSPLTGLILEHEIDSIEPAPTQAVFDALRAALAKLGLASGDDTQAPGAPGAARVQPVPMPVPRGWSRHERGG